MIRRAFVAVVAVVVAVGLTACGGARKSGVCSSAPTASGQGDASALEGQGDAAWAQRGDIAQLRSAIAAWSKALAVNPGNADLRVKLARAHYFLADGHLALDDESKEEMVANYELGTNQAELALGQKYPKYRAKYCSRQPFKSALQQLDKGAIAAMYWYATNLGKYALATNIVEVLNQKDRIKAMMELVRSLDPKFFYNAADRYFGAFYTKIPFPKGDLPLSARYFNEAISSSPEYLATRVLYADMNALKAKNKELFVKLLNEVVAFDVSRFPAIQAENSAEQQKAKNLLEELDVYFPE